MRLASSMSTSCSPRSGLVAGGTVPLVLKCTKRLYTAELIGVGASVNTTAAGIFAGAAQPVIGLAMVGASQARQAAQHGAACRSAMPALRRLIGILLVMSLPGIVGPLLDEEQIDRPRIALKSEGTVCRVCI